MMMTAGIDAARHVEPKRTDQLLSLWVLEALGDLLGDRDRTRIGKIAVVKPRAADHVAQEIVVTNGEPNSHEGVIHRNEIGPRDMRQHEILCVVHAQLVAAVALRQVSDELHLLGRRIARRAAGLLQRDHGYAIAGHAVATDIVLEPIGERGIGDPPLLHLFVHDRSRNEIRRRKVRLNPEKFRFRQIDLVPALRSGPIRFDFLAEFVDAELVDEDFDARLVEVVAAAIEIVHAQDRLDVGEQVPLLQKGANLETDIGRATHAAAHKHVEAIFAVGTLDNLQPDVVEQNGGTVFGGAGDGEFELSRQPAEFWMYGRPLTDHLAPGAWILELVHRSTGERIGRDVAERIAARLNAMHLDIGERIQDIRHIDQLDPVILEIGARSEMAVAAIPFAPDHGELAKLPRGEHAIGDGNAEHVSV